VFVLVDFTVAFTAGFKSFKIACPELLEGFNRFAQFKSL
jgi:hypothetical protein